MKTALITGVTGQDGAYLAKFLLEKNYQVVGVGKPNFYGLDYLNIRKDVEFVECDL